MPKSSKTLHKDFLKRLKALESTRKNFEKALSASAIDSNDIIQAYSGLYLDIFTEFENLIEVLFLGVLNGSIKPVNPSVIKRITIKPTSEVEQVLLGKKNDYLTWLPYPENTINRAKIYFTDAKPFSLLNDIQKGKISNYHKIRNAIAHKSKKALNEFSILIASSTLLPIERTPQGYLRNIPNQLVRKTQLEIIADELGAITFTLCC